MANNVDEWVARENIERFRRKIQQCGSGAERRQLEQLLQRELEKLRPSPKGGQGDRTA